eukprot:360600-Chlamydomonas_euryale.AAC.3
MGCHGPQPPQCQPAAQQPPAEAVAWQSHKCRSHPRLYHLPRTDNSRASCHTCSLRSRSRTAAVRVSSEAAAGVPRGSLASCVSIACSMSAVRRTVPASSTTSAPPPLSPPLAASPPRPKPLGFCSAYAGPVILKPSAAPAASTLSVSRAVEPTWKKRPMRPSATRSACASVAASDHTQPRSASASPQWL